MGDDTQFVPSSRHPLHQFKFKSYLNSTYLFYFVVCCKTTGYKRYNKNEIKSNSH